MPRNNTRYNASAHLTPDAVTNQSTAPADYNPNDYPPFALTVDLAVFTIRNGLLSVLLVERADDPYAGCWALPGGFVGIDETIETAALRELAEETSVDVFPGHVEQLRTYGNPNRDPRMRVVSVAHVAFAPNLPTPVAGSDAAAARWWPITDLMTTGDDRPRLAFDHEIILSDALDRVRAKLEYTTLAAQFLDEPFTLADLYRVYEAVWGTSPDLGNFRRKVLSTDGFVIPTNQTAPAAAGRPATLYTRGPATDLFPPMLRTDPDTAQEPLYAGAMTAVADGLLTGQGKASRRRRPRASTS